MERFHTDVCAVQLPLYQTPKILNRVCVNISANILDRVVDHRVLVFSGQAIIGLQRVTEERGTSLDILTYLAVQFVLTTRGNCKSADITAALHHPKSNRFVGSARTCDYALAAFLVHVPRLATDERFVNLDFTSQLCCRLILHRFANPTKHEPSGLLGYAKIAGHFVRTNSVFAVSKTVSQL